MTSLIFGSIYMGHKAITGHRREKSRMKNYERWEGLRDEYDAQRKISRESKSLDMQRTGNGFPETDGNVHTLGDRPILTLRDQQEANDARTSWRPQESWDTHTHTPVYGQQQQQQQRHSSLPVNAASIPVDAPMRTQPTGGTWDTPIPAPLRVSRRSYDDYDNRYRGGSAEESVSGQGSRSSSISRHSAGRGSLDGGRQEMGLHGSSQLRYNSSSRTAEQYEASNVDVRQDVHPNNPFSSAYYETRRLVPASNGNSEPPVQHNVPGGRMAELLDGMSYQQDHQQHHQQHQSQYEQIMPSMTAGGRMAELIERGY